VRYYAAWLGRWTSSDPGDFVDGLNLYVYVRNNPVNGVDELGYSTETVESVHIDEVGNVIHEYNDGDNGVYVHSNGTTKTEIDLQRNGGLYTGGDGNYIGQLGGSLDLGMYGIYQNKLVESANISLSEDFSFEQ
jgi:uncharacterized protein RhaS with RHS repeats